MASMGELQLLRLQQGAVHYATEVLADMIELMV